ncbi:Interferon-induced GTP-binding protein Mx3 [Coniochaeta hoffmannii]|uniref:Interferon-induced GTP-binding protein Mx3 n=1 Tax=Coniochaeta hoffmannii TaxID=91930 RepID=A0AA38R6T5_9PEZI|nr:Interferon-induced GTP-binding protein Mx3 [Coniochaeta hoffmannii]
MARNVSLDSAVLNQLSTAEAKNLLDTIDDLRELQVGDIVSLPQIIVVGAQSSGKSSVLEAISHVRFPTDGGVCTRFATELILRQAPTTTVDVSIQFSNKNDQSAARPFQLSGFSRDNLPELVNQAKERMGIRDGIKEFSDDILRVEITGPEMESLTLVDLPGLYQGSTADQSEEGVEFVDHLVDRYMRQENSIILAVVSAGYGLANQKILDKTKKHDPKRERTLGVITKPDLAGLAEQRHFLQLVKNQETAHTLALGWHVLRNRADKEEEQGLGDNERDAQEAQFFQTSPWSISKKTLPGLIGKIETNLDLRTAELQRLGMTRSTPDEWRSYLLGVARDFERLALEAVDGRYRDPFFGDIHDHTRKLRALLRNLNRAFDVTLCTKGARYEFEWYAAEDGSSKSYDDGDRISGGDTDRDQPAYLWPFIAEYKFPNPEPRSKAQVNEELEKWASANQGREFPGSPNNSLAIELFKMQARPWKAIAEFHVTKVLDVAKMIFANAEDLRNNIFGTQGAIDMTVAYYEMSLGIFTDNVINLAIENCIVCDIPNILTTTEVGGMKEDRLKALASESEEVQAQRIMLQEQVDILRHGLQKCKQHKPRESASLPLDFLGHPASASNGQSTSSKPSPQTFRLRIS